MLKVACSEPGEHETRNVSVRIGLVIGYTDIRYVDNTRL